MPEHSIEASPQLYARTGGLLYLLIIAIGLFGEAFVRGKLIVAGDAMRTAANLLQHETLWRTNIAAEMILLPCAAGLLMIEVLLLRPVSREFTLLAAILAMLSISMEAASTMYLIEPLFALGKGAYLEAFTPAQLAALARLPLRSHGYGFGLSLIFFGAFCIVVGFLIFHSGFLPKTIGVLMAIAGGCYLINSFALLLSPHLADLLFPAILLPAFIGELSLCLWLLVKGVDITKWKECVGSGHIAR